MRLSPSTLRLAVALGAAAGAFPQTPAAPGGAQKPGVAGIQRPMSYLVPDAIYSINGSPDWLAVTEDSVWVNSKPTDMVFRIDPKSDRVIAAVPVKKPCSGFAVAAGTLWSPSCEE